MRGIFRGVGWQKLGSILSFVSFYVLAWPIAAPLLILTSLGIKGKCSCSLEITVNLYILTYSHPNFLYIIDGNLCKVSIWAHAEYTFAVRPYTP